jgi:hypothetical protein
VKDEGREEDELVRLLRRKGDKLGEQSMRWPRYQFKSAVVEECLTAVKSSIVSERVEDNLEGRSGAKR